MYMFALNFLRNSYFHFQNFIFIVVSAFENILADVITKYIKHCYTYRKSIH